MQVGYAAALLGGALSFLSPCVLPLIIPYLGFLGGVTLRAAPGGPVAEAPERSRVIRAALFFVLGFATVFTALGATASLVSQLLSDHLAAVSAVAGLALIAFGLHFAGLLRLSFLNREKRIQVGRKPVSPLGAYAVGLAFAFGWTPCVGPVLAGILTIAAAAESAWQGAALLFTYALGIGIPFLLAAAFLTPFLRFVQRFRRHFRAVELAVGALLAATGAMVMTGTFGEIGAFILDRWPDLGRFG